MKALKVMAVKRLQGTLVATAAAAAAAAAVVVVVVAMTAAVVTAVAEMLRESKLS